mmetsp:Transcript_18315/g.31588  ORF Transcript_18315/g.31588 Transcript_18315/m.31588 type:complete len:210 (+) Transcript_18315:133-762(+)
MQKARTWVTECTVLKSVWKQGCVHCVRMQQCIPSHGICNSLSDPIKTSSCIPLTSVSLHHIRSCFGASRSTLVLICFVLATFRTFPGVFVLVCLLRLELVRGPKLARELLGEQGENHCHPVSLARHFMHATADDFEGRHKVLEQGKNFAGRDAILVYQKVLLPMPEKFIQVPVEETTRVHGHGAGKRDRWDRRWIQVHTITDGQGEVQR